jgi:predicted RNA polymerase sigma factor
VSGPVRGDVDGAIAHVYRSEWGRLLSMLVARTRRLDLAEDALSEAFARASAASDTDWRAISSLYAELEALTRSPVVRLDRAVAVAEARGAAAGLALLDGLDEALGPDGR